MRKLQRPAEALASYQRAIAIKPDYAEAHCNRGNLLKDQGAADAALECYERALALRPAYREAHFNRGNVLKECLRFEEALASYDAAIALDPLYADAHLNRGNVLKELRRFMAATASYERAIELGGQSGEARFNRSTGLLFPRKSQDGWLGYESRWQLGTSGDGPGGRSFTQPRWSRKTAMPGATIFLHAEQGLGDTIQFARYATLVADTPANVILEVQPSLVELLRRLDVRIPVVDRGMPLPGFDYHCPLLSLPLELRPDSIHSPRRSVLVTRSVKVDRCARHWAHKPSRSLESHGAATRGKSTITIVVSASLIGSRTFQLGFDTSPAKRHIRCRPCGAARPRCDIGLLQRVGRLFGHRCAVVVHGPGHQRRYQCGASEWGPRQPNLGPAGVQPGLALAVGSR